MADKTLRIPTGSLVFVRGKSFLSGIILRMQREPGESRSLVSHVGMVVEGGTLKDCEIVEALWKVRRHRLWDRYHAGPDKIAIFKPLGFGIDQIFKVCLAAEGYVGRRYGPLKLLAHAVDYLLQGRYVARRLCRLENYPICSWLTASAWDAIDYRFLGRHPAQSQPDDQWDHCKKTPAQWECILPLQRI
jgi:hypothetical protein